MRTVTVAFRCSPSLAAWLNDVADRDHTQPSTVVRRLIEQARDERWPADVTHWLTAQAACIGQPGDPDAALIAVVRHLARRWPHGARLNP
jgi:hypothetical protein